MQEWLLRRAKKVTYTLHCLRLLVIIDIIPMNEPLGVYNHEILN